MKLQVQTPALGAPQHPQMSCALLAPKQPVHSQTRLKVPFPPHPNYNQASPAFTFSSPNRTSRSLSHKPNTIEFA